MGQPADIELASLLRATHQQDWQTTLEEPQWSTLVPRACSAWLGGLLLDGVKRHGWNVDLPRLQEIRWQSSQIARTNVRSFEMLARVAQACQQRDVELLLLKGAALNLTLYNRPGLRPMSDLDLLVREKDLSGATAALRKCGFHRGAGLVRQDFFPRYYYATEFLTEGPQPIRVDLHVRPFRPLLYAHTIPEEAFWIRSQAVDVGGATVRVPATEEQFVHLATHSAIHGHSRLIWLYDMCRLIDKSGENLDWTRVLEFSKRQGLVLPVRDTIKKLEALWGPMVPDHFRESLRMERVGLRDRLCLAQTPHDSARPIRHVAVNLLCARGARWRWGYLRSVLLPNRSHMQHVYSRRHRGWIFVAHLRRFVHALLRPVAHAMHLSHPHEV